MQIFMNLQLFGIGSISSEQYLLKTNSIFFLIFLGQRSTKIIAPPASLTSDMHERKASAQDCEIQIVRI